MKRRASAHLDRGPSWPTVLSVVFLCAWAAQPRAQAQSDTLIINAVGDVSLPAKAFKPVIEAQGARLFDGVKEVLDEGDLNFVNIETAITNSEATAKKKFSFSMPPQRLDWLVEAGFNLISLANNHINDAGPQGVRDSIDAIVSRSSKERPLVFSGASLDPEDRYKPVYLERKGLKIAFFCLGFENTSHSLEPGSPVHQVRDPKYNDAIRASRAKADLVLVSAHFGREYQHAPGREALRLYRGFVDAGADLVIGHHPHVIRGVERYKEGVILHSLGNFSFASRTARHRKTDAKMYSMIAQVEVKKGKISALRLVPLYVNNLEGWSLGGRKLPKANFAPVLLDGVFAKAVVEALDGWSRAIPGNPARVTLEAGVGVVRW